MSWRIRHCVECPKCATRYLVGFSPYENGSYLIPIARGTDQEWTLYCSCGTPHSSSRWTSDEMKAYHVSRYAHGRGFGPPEEIIQISRLQHGSSSNIPGIQDLKETKSGTHITRTKS